MLSRRAFSLLVLCCAPLAAGPADPWSPRQVIHPADLAKALDSAEPPVILMVGPRILYNGDHIRGAIYAGPASADAGVALLKERVSAFPLNAHLVLYCGCCPMEKCPNIRPAFTSLQNAGYKDVKILEIPTNLYTDWTAKGYPVEKGSVGKENAGM